MECQVCPLATWAIQQKDGGSRVDTAVIVSPNSSAKLKSTARQEKEERQRRQRYPRLLGCPVVFLVIIGNDHNSNKNLDDDKERILQT